MDDARTVGLPHAGHLREAGQQAVGRGSVGLAGTGVDHHAGRLVHHHDLGIGVHDDHGNVRVARQRRRAVGSRRDIQ